jgi:acyl-CoA synthetase (AMP-forming)/AMP-acid ligase II
MNISGLVDMVADGCADRILIGDRESGLSGRRIRQLSIGGARAIEDASADCVVYFGTNGPAFQLALFSAARAGVPFVPINYRLGADQLQAMLANHPGGLGVATSDGVQQLRAAGQISWSTDEWLARIAGLAADDGKSAYESDSAAVLIYTSGTTSAPKAVVLRHSHLTSYVLNTVEFAGADESEAFLVSVPPYHIAAVASAITNLYAGRRAIALEHFTAERWLQTVREQRVTQALVVPTMLARIMEADDGELDIPTLRSLAYGGAAMPASVLERALRRWLGVDFVNAYGLTETSSTITVLGPEEHREAFASKDPAVSARLGSVGRALPGVELQIRGHDGRVVPAGTTGGIWVRGGQVSAEYMGRGRAADADGFFNTRDEGYLDTDGYLFVGGRADDTIIRGGENIAPAEIEDVLLAHEEVVDAVAVGIPDREWGQHIEAAVVLRAGARTDPDKLREFVRARLRASRTPDRIFAWDELPRTETGKLVRRTAVMRILADQEPTVGQQP